jgi:hypothetical protein
MVQGKISKLSKGQKSTDTIFILVSQLHYKYSNLWYTILVMLINYSATLINICNEQKMSNSDEDFEQTNDMDTKN